MADAFDDLLKDPVFGAPEVAPEPASAVSQTPGPTPIAAATTPAAADPFASVVEEATKPVEAEASIWNALPRGVSSVKQGANASWFAAQRLAGQAPDPSSMIEAFHAGEEYDKLYPKTQGELDAEKAFFKDGDWSQLLNPRFIASTALESLPSIVGPIAGSVLGGVAGSTVGPVGTTAGIFAGTGAGSGLIDYGASYKDYLSKKLGPFNREVWDNAVRTDPNLLDEAHAWAAKHSGMVAAFDMIGMKVGGALAKPALEAGTGIGRRAAAVAGGIGTEGVTETLGESTGTGLASGGTDWNVKEAILGGVAASATGGAHSFIEPIAGKITGHGKPVEAATDPAIEDAFRAFSGGPSVVADPVGAPVAASAVAPGPIWRSALRDVVDAKGPGFATSDQWIATIRNQPGIKAEEIEATGVENWLRGQEGKISKSDVMAEIEANQVDVRDVVPEESRFEKFQLPGGENYKELLLTLPRQEKQGAPIVDDGTLDNLAVRPGEPTVNREAGFTNTHFPSIPNVLAHVRFNERIDVDGQPTLHLEEVQSDWHQTGRKEGYGPSVENGRVFPRRVPDAPFKSTWHELAFKRMLRYAADNGFSRITWTPPEEQISRYETTHPVNGEAIGLDAEGKRGMHEFYGKIIPSVAKKWAKRFGGTYGETKLEIPADATDPAGLVRYVDVPYIDVPAAAAGIIQRGMPTFSLQAPDRLTISPDTEIESMLNDNVRFRGEDVEMLYPALIELKKKMRLNLPLRVHVSTKNNGMYGQLLYDGNGGYIIEVNALLHKDAGQVWGTMVHELGHMIFFEKFATAPTPTQMAIRAAYETFRQETQMTDTLESLILRRDSAIAAMQRDGTGQMPLYELSPDQRKYWAGFDEWAAEQVVKWATTDERPLTIVDKWFRGMGRHLKAVFDTATAMFTRNDRGQFAPQITVASWLNSFIDSAPSMGATVYPEVDKKTKQANQDATASESPYVEASEQTFATQPFREGMKILFNSQVPPSVSAMAAQGDKINKFSELMLSVQQLAARNPHIRSLQLYREDIALWQLEKQQLMDTALKSLKEWKKIRGPQADNVATLIDEMMNMTYLPKGEAARKPTQTEFEDMVKRIGVSDAGLRVFARITTDFDTMLTNYENLMIRETGKIADPITRFQSQQDIRASIQRMRNVPYFPAMRFGEYTVTVRDGNGKVIHFETQEKQKGQKAAAEALRQQMSPGDTISLGILPKDARPLLGMPPGLLDMIGDKLTLSPTQKETLQQLRFEMAPAQSFKHRFQRKRLVKGYSTDFMRAYANYMFHGSNHFARIKYADQLRDHVRDVREQAKFMPDGVARGRIANFMSDHLQNVLDPKPDFVRLRSMMFMWALAFSPAAAGVNLTQTLVVSFPYLASKFGDGKAMNAMLKAGTSVSSFYKRGEYENSTNLEFQAINEAVKEGVISEAMAPELAAISEGRNLSKGFGGNVSERAWSKFAEMGSWMFEMTEQINRRIVFRAAFNLAMQNPTAKHIQEVVRTNSRQYDRLRTAGWTEQAASAFVVAKQATEATQYQYSAAAQPRFMRGKLRTVFVFKSFVQNTLFFLWNYPAAAVRSMLIMGFLGGLMGIPGADDLKDILKVIGWNIFGKNFNLEHEVRKFVMEMADGTVDPDILLHGVARKGYGIPAVLDMLGGTVGINIPYPSLDRSRAVGIGNINPVPLAPMFGPPSRDESRGIAESVQKASGAAFGLGFNIVKAITDSQLNATDWKRWEKAMPRALASLSRSYRAMSEGGERTKSGAQVLKFDTNDTEQMMEALAMAGGYTPTRLSREWDKRIAQQEVATYWDLRRSGILKQYFDAYNGSDHDDVERVKGAIAKFNQDLPKEAKAMSISDQTIDRSMKARARSRDALESGTPTQKSKAGLYQMIDRMYPGSTTVDVQKR